MRFKSRSKNGYTAYAVSGVNSISFAVDASGANTKGLLGFSVKRKDKKENQEYFMFNYKVFQDVIPNPQPNTQHSSYQFPIQSFVWDDFSTREEREYTYYFYPVKGDSKNLIHESPVEIRVKTEPLYSKTNAHDIFFNRGVASSQAYALQFGNQPPDQINNAAKRKRAYDWLSRNLDEAILKFIRNAKKGDSLLGCFYEFRYAPVLDEFKKAIDRGVHVRIIYDAKVNESTDKKGVFHESFPREDNLRFIRKAKIPAANLVRREASENYIQHNKFMILLKGKKETPAAVWFGSTNLSTGGIHGQTNVGHWVSDQGVAESFKQYWDILSKDPGMQPGDTAAKRRADNKKFKESIEAISPDLEFTTLDDIPNGETCFFSPRPKKEMLEIYAQILDAAENVSCITLAFGISDVFKSLLADNRQQDQITFMLLEKKDKPTKTNKDTFVYINSRNNVYKAFGSYLKDPLYQWTREVNTQTMKLNTHVKYVHSKFLLADPLSEEPVVVAGSANFSNPSTVSNDENMVLIKGNLRVADIYFTEFMRIFYHYYFRSVFEELKNKSAEGGDSLDAKATIFLDPDDGWLDKYKPGTFRSKRVRLFVEMSKAKRLKVT
jgi:phosphatidylserine/phosphatidylglycerophosphate/cardiolipin synthase-like enzyme